ncbi:MAG: hypothetical protein HY939_02480 [Gammaproteobacteria bacterium]|nr:hypothetical protein [Gammaproteobacteria bacterium]
MSELPQSIKSLYFSAIKFTPKIYFRLRYVILSSVLFALTLYTLSDHTSLDLARLFPGTTLLLSILFSCLVYGFLASTTYNIYSQQYTHAYQAFLQFLKLQGKWWGGMGLLVAPAFLALGLIQLAQYFHTTLPYASVALYFVAIILLVWSFLYLPMFIIYIFSLFSEPTLSFITSLKYVFRLCCYNWLRIVFSTLFFYGVFFIICDLLSSYYLQHLSKGPYFFTNLICINLIFYLLLPFLTSYSLALVNDLRIRNLPCAS